jgi:hypothetical protein
VEAPPVAPAAPSAETLAEAPPIAPAAEQPAESAASPTANLIRELEEAAKLVETAKSETAKSEPAKSETDKSEPDKSETAAEPARGLIERDAAVSDEPAKKSAPRRRGLALFALIMSLIAIALAGLIGAWRFAPHLLPKELSATTLLDLPEPEPPPLPPPRKPAPPDFDE